MGVDVRVLYDCPLGWPGVVLVREEAVWWVLVDPTTDDDAVAMAIDNIRTLAELTEVPAAQESQESQEDGEALGSTRRGGWTWTSALTMVGAAAVVVGLFFVPSLQSASDATSTTPPAPVPVDPRVPTPALPGSSPATQFTLPEQTQLAGEVLLAAPSTPSQTVVITTVIEAPVTAVSAPASQPPSCVLCRLVIRLG